MCMYIYMYMYIFTCIYVQLYMYICIYTYITLTEIHETMNESIVQVDSKTQVEFSEVLGQVGHTTLRDVSFRHSYS
jgi:cytochrome c oxidase assembly protein Cox11